MAVHRNGLGDAAVGKGVEGDVRSSDQDGAEGGVMSHERHSTDGIIALSPDGARLALLSDWQTLRVFNLAGKRNSETIRVPQGSFQALTFAPDGKILACELTH